MFFGDRGGGTTAKLDNSLHTYPSLLLVVLARVGPDPSLLLVVLARVGPDIFLLLILARASDRI